MGGSAHTIGHLSIDIADDGDVEPEEVGDPCTSQRKTTAKQSALSRYFM